MRDDCRNVNDTVQGAPGADDYSLSFLRWADFTRGLFRGLEFFDAQVPSIWKRSLTILFWGASVSLIFLPGVACPQDAPPPQNRQDDRFTISVTVDMVVLHATVQDRNGALVSGLGNEAFQVFEDGVRQQVISFSHEDIPVTVGLVVDNSGSMRPKRPEVISAILGFARSSNAQDQMFVVSFNEHVTFGLPADTPFTDKAIQLQAALSRFAASGTTALYDALAAALEHLKTGDRDKKVLMVISDGGDNASKCDLAQIMAMAGRSNAIIYTIGVFDENDPDRNPRVLERLARATGGEAFLPRSSSDILSICKRIATDIRNQYSMIYLPTNQKQDGLFRVIQVYAAPLRGERLSVRTRTGYYAPLAPPPPPTTGAIP